MRRRRERALRDDELALWRHVARSVTPMPGRAMPAEEPAPAAVPEPVEPPAATAPRALLASRRTEKRPALTPLAPLERSLRVALKRGRQEVDATLDLHGLRQAEAHAALVAFIARSHRKGARVVLVVTGKGGRAPERSLFEERGILRRLVPQWLALPDLRGMVLGFDEAARGHGGEGALYVRLRRRSHEEAWRL